LAVDDELLALLEHLRLEPLDERRALLRRDREEDLRRAHEVRDHAPAAVRRELDADRRQLLRDRLERVATSDEEDRRPAGDDARRAGRPREQRHLAEERAVREARERHRPAVFLVLAPDLELSARDDVRLRALLALL